MKKIIVFTLLFLLLSPCIVSADYTYHNEEFGFSINLIGANEDEIEIFPLGINLNATDIHIGVTLSYDDVLPYLNSENRDECYAGSEYCSIEDIVLYHNNILSSVSAEVDAEYEIINSSRSEIAGLPASNIVYSTPNVLSDNETLIMSSYLTIYDGYLYYIEVFYFEGYYNDMVGEMEDTLSSFTLDGVGKTTEVTVAKDGANGINFPLIYGIAILAILAGGIAFTINKAKEKKRLQEMKDNIENEKHNSLNGYE